MASKGLGYALLPTRVAQQYKSLVPLRDSPTYHDEISLIYRSEKQQNKTSKKIIETILSYQY